jgi:hypothetical protein
MFTMPGSDVKKLVITAEIVKNGLSPVTVTSEKKSRKKIGKNVA